MRQTDKDSCYGVWFKFENTLDDPTHNAGFVHGYPDHAKSKYHFDQKSCRWERECGGRSCETVMLRGKLLGAW